MRNCRVGGGDVLEEVNPVVQTGLLSLTKGGFQFILCPSSPLWTLTLSTDSPG